MHEEYMRQALALAQEAAAQSPLELSAPSAVLMEKETGTILYEKEAKRQMEPASVTKVMTLLLIMEALDSGRISREDVVTVSARASGMGGSQVYLKEGEQMTVGELIKCITVVSGNDATVAMAEYLAGSESAFVQQMNQRAQDLGMTNTHFSDPNGLGDENHYASALDMAKLGVACLQNPTVAEILSTRTITLEGRQLTNHNKLLWQYEGCTGMKTGYTRQAGRTLVSSAERNGQTLVCVTLNDRDDWNDHKALLDYGFSAFPRQVLAEEGEELGRVPLQGSLLHMASVEARETVAYPLKQGEEVTMEVDLPDQAEAPVVQGEIAGSVRFLVGSRQVGQTYLVWSGSARRDVVKERPVDSPLDFLPQSTPPTYEEMLSLFSKAGTVSEYNGRARWKIVCKRYSPRRECAPAAGRNPTYNRAGSQ